MFIVFDSKIRILLPFLRRRGLVMVAALVSVVRGMCVCEQVLGGMCVCVHVNGLQHARGRRKLFCDA